MRKFRWKSGAVGWELRFDGGGGSWYGPTGELKDVATITLEEAIKNVEFEEIVEKAVDDEPTIKDSGKREEFATGSVRDTRDGKGRYDLLPPFAIERIAKHFEAGCVKYGDNNWRKGQPLRRYIDSALRHLFKYLEGHRDEPHDSAAAWNILALIETQEMIRRGILPKELDDLPNYTEGRND